jgi:4-amino-4-deoxy-L-arabinose transferase-like glycosyltransferase
VSLADVRGSGRWGEIAHRVRRAASQPWLLAILAATGVALALRLWGIAHQSYWYDESLTVDEMRMRFLRMLSSVRQTEVTPPLYFVGAWTWSHIFGTGEAGLRSFSAVAGALTVPAVAACALTLAGRRAAVVAAALTAVNPLLIWYSQEARSYALSTLLGALSWLFFLRAARQARRRDFGLWAAASALMIATHYFAIFLVAPEALWLLARWRHRRSAWTAVAAVGAVGLLLLPLAASRRGNGTGWIHGTPLGLRLRQIPMQIAAGFSNSTFAVAGTAALALVAVLLLLGGGDARARRGAAIAAATAAVILLTPLVLGQAGLDYLITRNVVFVTVPIAVLVAAGLTVRRARWAGVAATVALCVLAVTATAEIHASPRLQRPAWRAVAARLGAGQGIRAIVVAGSYRARPLKTYLPNTRFFQGRPAPREIDVIGMQSPRQPGCWWGSECNLPNARPSNIPPAPGFRLIGERRVGDFYVSRFRSDRPMRLTTCSDVLRSQARFRGRALHSVVVFLQTERPAKLGARPARAAARPIPAALPRHNGGRRPPQSAKRHFGCPRGAPGTTKQETGGNP